MAEFNYTLDVQVKGAEKVEDLQKNLDSLDDKQVKVSVESNDEDAKQTKELLDEIGETDATAKASVDSDTGQAEELLNATAEIDATDVTANADVNSDITGADDVINAIDEVDGSEGTGEAKIQSDTTQGIEAQEILDDVDGKFSEGEINIDSDTEQAESKIEHIDNSVNGLTEKQNIIKINADIVDIENTIAELRRDMVKACMDGEVDVAKSIEANVNALTRTLEIMKEQAENGIMDIRTSAKGLANDSSWSAMFKNIGGGIDNLRSSWSKLKKGDFSGALDGAKSGLSGLKNGLSIVGEKVPILGKLGNVLGNVGSKAIAMGSAVASAVAPMSLLALATKKAVDILKSFAEEGKKISNTKLKLDVDASSVEKLTAIGEWYGVSIDTITSSTQRMFKNIYNESPKAVASIEKLTGSFEEFKGLSTEDQMAKLGEGFKTIKKPVERTALAMAIFGKSGTNMIKICEDLADANNDVSKSLQAQVAYTEEGIQRSDSFMRTIGEFGRRLKAITTPIATAFMPLVEAVVEIGNAFLSVLKPAVDVTFTIIGEFCQVLGALFGGLANLVQTFADSVTIAFQNIANLPGMDRFIGWGERALGIMEMLNSKLGTFLGNALSKTAEYTKEATDETNKYVQSTEEEADAVDEASDSISDLTEEFELNADAIRRSKENMQDYKSVLEGGLGDDIVSGGLGDMDKLLENSMNKFKDKNNKDFGFKEMKAEMLKEAQDVYDSTAKTLRQSYEMGEIDATEYEAKMSELNVETEEKLRQMEETIKEATGQEIDLSIKTNSPEVTAQMNYLALEWSNLSNQLSEEQMATLVCRVQNGELVTDVVREMTAGTEGEATLHANVEGGEDVDKTTQEIEKGAEGEAKVTADTDTAQSDLDKTKEKIDAIKDKKITISASTYTAISNIDKVKKELDELKSKSLQVTVHHSNTGDVCKCVTHAKATARPYKYNTPTMVEVGEYQEEVILGTNIYEQALQNAMGLGVEQGAMMTANNLGNVASGVDSSILHNDLATIIGLMRTMDTAGGNQVVNVINGKQVSSTSTGSKTETITTTLRNIGNKNAGITTQELRLVEAVLREIL